MNTNASNQVFGTSPDHPSTASLPQHGFARTSRWEFLGKSTTESSDKGSGDTDVKLDFGLGPENLSAEARTKWGYNFAVIYSVTLGQSSLRTSILVRNEGQESWDFQTLMHTYLRVPVSLPYNLIFLCFEIRG
jgi:glucose-6-phosphate 1-epimerase